MPRIHRSQVPSFSPGQLEQLCKVLADTHSGLTGTQIGHLLQQAGVEDVDPNNTKWKRLYNALAQRHNRDGHGNAVLNFIRYALDPARYGGNRQQFERRRRAVNSPLAFAGLKFGKDGKFHRISRAETLDEAERRADRLRSVLEERGVHSDVLKYCKAELLEDNYFHAVLEATKSVAEKIRNSTEIDKDGARLVDAALGGQSPIMKINDLSSKSKRSEQSGFVNLLKGLFGLFRNPTAHEPRREWKMAEDDALDLFVLASYAHRRIDSAEVQQQKAN